VKYLIDTTWIIEYLRGNQAIARTLQQFRNEGLAVSVVSLGELYEGVFRSRNPTESERALSDFLKSVIILDLTAGISKTFGRERAELRRRGVPVGDLDLLIASTALQHSLTLLTADRDFERVQNLTTILS
jgi:tRNA(fMet)-specific endonuclease VapC